MEHQTQKIALNLHQNFVCPLQEAQNEFLQVLVTEFAVRAKDVGFELNVAFDSRSKAIWRRDAKEHIKEKLLAQTKIRAKYKAAIKALFAGKTRQFIPDERSFPFRLGNGGNRRDEELADAKRVIPGS